MERNCLLGAKGNVHELTVGATHYVTHRRAKFTLDFNYLSRRNARRR